MIPRLVCRDGAIVGPYFAAPRYRSCAGDIIDATQPHARITLAMAAEGLGLFRSEAAETLNPREARLLEMWGDELASAIVDCRLQRLAAGWLDPYAADRLGAGTRARVLTEETA